MISKTLWREQIVERIMEAEDRISEVVDRIAEINETDRKTKKELREMRTTSETSGTMLNAPTFKS